MDPGATTFSVTDVETTGRSAERNRITEIAVVEIRNGEIVGENSTLVNPWQYISREIQELTGITNGMVSAAPAACDIFPTVRTWMPDDAVFTAHNVQFDFNFVQQTLRRSGLPTLASPTLCTLRLARRLLPARRGFSLGRLASYLGVRINARHRALGDARATARILLLLLEIARDQHGCTSLEELLTLQYRPTTAFREAPKRLGGLADSVRQFPTGPGIYRMIGRGDEVLYVGKARSLRERVASYFRPGGGHNRKNTEMIARVRRVEYELTGSELSAILLESKLIKTLQPKYNVAGKRIRRYAFIRIDRAGPYPKPEVTVTVLPDGADYFGPFRNRDEAGMLIETLQRIFPLRECDGPITPAPSNIPCLYHAIRRCSAPCAGRIAPDDYRKIVDQVIHVLNGSEEGITSVIRSQMERAAAELDFETAAELRDRLGEVERVFVWKQQISESVNQNNMAVVIPEQEGGGERIYLLLHGRLFHESRIGARFPRKRIEEICARALRRLVDPPELSDPLAIDEVRLVAGYLRRTSESRRVIPLNPESDPVSLVRAIERSLQGEHPAP